MVVRGEGRPVSDERYRAGILRGLMSGRTPGNWPPEIPGLGPVQGGQPLGRCVRCPEETHPSRATSNVTYGGRPYCKPCAQREAAVALASQEGA